MNTISNKYKIIDKIGNGSFGTENENQYLVIDLLGQLLSQYIFL
jgi:hypothetical protein